MAIKSIINKAFTSASIKISDPPWTAKVIRQIVESSSEEKKQENDRSITGGK